MAVIALDRMMNKSVVVIMSIWLVTVSVSGYSSVAITEASGSKTPLLLFDAQHLYIALSQTLPLPEVIDRVRRHASQTGEAYLSTQNFSG